MKLVTKAMATEPVAIQRNVAAIALLSILSIYSETFGLRFVARTFSDDGPHDSLEEIVDEPVESPQIGPGEWTELGAYDCPLGARGEDTKGSAKIAKDRGAYDEILAYSQGACSAIDECHDDPVL